MSKRFTARAGAPRRSQGLEELPMRRRRRSPSDRWRVLGLTFVAGATAGALIVAALGDLGTDSSRANVIRRYDQGFADGASAVASDLEAEYRARIAKLNRSVASAPGQLIGPGWGDTWLRIGE